MRFNNGYWMTKQEFVMSYATQCVRTTKTDKALQVISACRPVRHRGDVLDGGTLTVTFTAPRKNVIRVKVTMDGDKIAKIKTIEQHETRGLGTTAMLKLTDEIIKANTVDVDSITGATLTSVSFKAAVRQAVETALGTDPAAAVELGENEYLGLSNNALGGRLMVKVTAENGVVKAIDVLEAYESEEIGGVALAAQVQKMIETGNAEVDNISGATITCKALCEAVNMALEAAK